MFDLPLKSYFFPLLFQREIFFKSLMFDNSLVSCHSNLVWYLWSKIHLKDFSSSPPQTILEKSSCFAYWNGAKQFVRLWCHTFHFLCIVQKYTWADLENRSCCLMFNMLNRLLYLFPGTIWFIWCQNLSRMKETMKRLFKHQSVNFYFPPVFTYLHIVF